MKPRQAGGTPFFTTRGVVLTPEDLTLKDWPERAQRAGLTTLALHTSPGRIVDFVRSEAGQAFLSRCRELGLQVEYELHAMADLLPRALFAKDTALFRMDEKGARNPDANLCVNSEKALHAVCENALVTSRTLRPTTGRHFFWGDDGAAWCRCSRCRDLSDSEQALIMENRLIEALRREDPRAQVAHLAYANTLPPPRQVKPKPGIFLEFAPIRRRYDVPYGAQTGPAQPDSLAMLDDNLKVFGAKGAQALEYWLDVSRFSNWKKPAVRLPWDSGVFAADLNTYGSRGICHVTTFAVYINAEYVSRYGDPPLDEYGERLRDWRREQKSPR